MELSALFEQLPDLVVCRDAERKIRMVNTAFVDVFGKSAGEWVGQRLDGAVSGAQIGAFDEDRAYGHIEVGGKLHWIEWIETDLAEGGTLAMGRLNPDRRISQRAQDDGRACRRRNRARTYVTEPARGSLPDEPELQTEPVSPPNSPAVPKVQPVPKPAAPAARPATKVLLAEDDLLNAKLACALLQRSGCVVTHVENGEDALAAAKTQDFDLVFMDVRMPVMDGLSATRAIRALGGNWAHIPIVALTANAFAEDKQACHRAGMNGFLTKPISVDALEAAQKRWTQTSKQAKTG
jgi:CheY-like chemotaxis protein